MGPLRDPGCWTEMGPWPNPAGLLLGSYAVLLFSHVCRYGEKNVSNFLYFRHRLGFSKLKFCVAQQQFKETLMRSIILLNNLNIISMYSRGEQRLLPLVSIFAAKSVSCKVHLLLLPKAARILILVFKKSYFVCVCVRACAHAQ